MTDKIFQYRINQTKTVNGVQYPNPHYVRVCSIEQHPSDEADKTELWARLCTYPNNIATTAYPNAPEITENIVVKVLDSDLKGANSIDVVLDNAIRTTYLEAAYTAGNIVKE